MCARAFVQVRKYVLFFRQVENTGESGCLFAEICWATLKGEVSVVYREVRIERVQSGAFEVMTTAGVYGYF